MTWKVPSASPSWVHEKGYKTKLVTLPPRSIEALIASTKNRSGPWAMRTKRYNRSPSCPPVPSIYSLKKKTFGPLMIPTETKLGPASMKWQKKKQNKGVWPGNERSTVGGKRRRRPEAVYDRSLISLRSFSGKMRDWDESRKKRYDSQTAWTFLTGLGSSDA